MQTEYKPFPDAGRPGLIANLNDVLTESAKSDAVAYFGRLLSQNSAGETFHPAAATDITVKGAVKGVVVACFQAVNGVGEEAPHHPVSTPFAVLRKGQIEVALDQDVTPESDVFVRFAENAGVNEVQSLTPSAAPASGQIVLSFMDEATDAIAYNATADEIQTALRALTTIGAGNVTVTGTFATAVSVTFTGTLAKKNVENLGIESCTFATAVPAPVTVTQAVVTPGEETTDDSVGMFRADDDDPSGDSSDPKAAQLQNARYITSGLKGSTAVVDLDL